MLAVVVSRADDASVRIGEHLREMADTRQVRDDTRPDAEGGGTVARADGLAIREFDRLHLDLVRPADAFDDPDLLVFASRHSGETGPLLTAHHTGNVGPADHGGEPDELARACPNAHRTVVEALAEHAPDGYDVGIECTHHGPSEVGAPSMFVEVGSGPEQWADPDAAEAVASAIFALRGVAPDRPADTDVDRHHLIGIGGGHYAPRFERIVRETDWAIGHVLADWGLDRLDGLDGSRGRDLLSEALERSRAAYALFDRDADDAAVAAVGAAGGRCVDETWVRETDGLALDFVRRVEDAVMTVEEGLRFGDAAGHDGGFDVEPLPETLLDEARGIDRGTVRDLLERTALAFGTDQGGSRVTGPAVLRPSANRAPIVAGLVDLLRERYDEVERTGDAVIARETAFDPEKAATLGVPEGPKFGRLAGGEPVEVDGDTVPPEAVHEEREKRFEVYTGRRKS
ncbi:MAG: D-aminoacyl-tRNA deacylase [Salinirussus sp.]